MLLSLQKKFIFIHIPKTAGTSIMLALRPWSLPQAKKSQWRRLLSHLPVKEAVDKAFFRQHVKAARLRQKLPDGIYDSAYKFAVVRNPFDLVVSTYHFRRKVPTTRRHQQVLNWDFPTFVRYLEHRARLQRIDQTSWLTDRSGELIVDEVLRFESLADGFNQLMAKLDIPDAMLPKVNTTVHDTYSAYYDDASKAIVQRIYARDFERWGYSF